MDYRLYHWMNRLQDRTSALHTPLADYAKYGVGVFAVLALVGLWMARRRTSRDTALVLWAGVAALVALAINQGIGHLVGRARPYLTHPAAHVLIHKGHDFSFPSDHTSGVAAIAAALWLFDRRLGIVAFVLALAMAFTRVYVGAHYPGDVLAALIVGSTVGLLLARLAVPVITRLVELAERTPLRPVVRRAA